MIKQLGPALFFAALSLATAAHAQVARDANATADTATPSAMTTISINLTVGNGANRAMFPQLVFGTQNIGTENCSWTVGSTVQNLSGPITFGNSTDAVKGRVEIWGLLAPTSGAGTLTCTWQNPSYAFLNVTSYNGVNQTGGTASFTPATSTQGASTAPAITVPSAAGDMAIAVVAGGTTIQSPTPYLFVDNSGAGPVGGGALDAAGAANVNFGWTLIASKFWAVAGHFGWTLIASKFWAVAGLDIHAANPPPPPPPPTFTGSCQGQAIPVYSNSPLLCTKTFSVTGTCAAGNDATMNWSGAGAVPVGGSINGVPWYGEGPWETGPISIVGAAIVVTQPCAGMYYAFIGDSYTPDPVMWYDKGASVGATEKFWGPYAMQFPAPNPSIPWHLDLHVGSGGGGYFAGYVAIKYTVP
jgi:hypothetical protein